MGLSQALSIAMSGLRANQAALSLVSSNAANSETPGYVRKTTNVIDTSHGVRTVGVNRELDTYVQNQLRTELSGSGYATTKSTFLDNLQGVYGDPDSDATLEASFNALTTALQALSTSSDTDSARKSVINAAQTMAAQLNQTSDGIQGLRAAADSGINSAVKAANDAMAQIAKINQSIGGATTLDASTASLLDQRDQYIDQLSQLMDIRVVPGDGNQVNVYTGAGFQLVGGPNAAKLSFTPTGTMTPDAQWGSDPTKSDLSSVSLQYPDGSKIDLTAEHGIRSGAIAAYTELRDTTLVQAQNQVDALAASMSSALSDNTTAGTAVTAGPQSGFDIDLSALQPATGNKGSVNITYTDTATNKQVSKSIAVDLSGGMASVVSQLNTALAGTGVQFSNPASPPAASANVLRVLDDGTSNVADVNSVSLTTTATKLTDNGGPQLPFFTDGNSPYVYGSDKTGLAGRIAVNPALLSDPSRLVVYNTSPTTPSGDTTRADFILSQLTNSASTYPADTGVGSAKTPFKGTILSFTQQFTAMQGDAASAADSVADGQSVVVNTLQNKMSQTSGVDLDTEMANLMALQNAYSANARVMSTVNSMYQSLLQAF
ncbi:flagellar hook-associated protein FlgK [Bradyrhizobium sp. SYSU BS000235]|uniref:flagellar hook-associated protein FlgK n=1 Tax=Bradyrhizobium sp. SYSU BS000235 TaxID=3411332 RepID=UPI003C7314EE